MNENRGFTMVELLAALVLLGVFLASVLYMFQSSSRGISLNRAEYLAHCAASELVDQLLSIPYENLPTGVFTEGSVVDSATIGSQTVWPFHLCDTGSLTRRLEIFENRQSQHTRFKKIVVTLTFPAFGGGTQLRQMKRTVLYAKEGM